MKNSVTIGHRVLQTFCSCIIGALGSIPYATAVYALSRPYMQFNDCMSDGFFSLYLMIVGFFLTTATAATVWSHLIRNTRGAAVTSLVTGCIMGSLHAIDFFDASISSTLTAKLASSGPTLLWSGLLVVYGAYTMLCVNSKQNRIEKGITFSDT